MATDSTVSTFDQFYDFKLNVGADQYEVVYSFFQAYTNSVKTAQSFTSTLFAIADKTDINVLDLLETFKTAGGDSIKVSLTMAYYLNSINDKTVMYGVNNLLSPNNLVQRNIVQ
jgi:hypothetical protein